MTRILFDSDICLDYLLERPDHISLAQALFDQLKSELFSAYVCAVSLTTVHYLVRRERDKATALMAVDNLLVFANVCAVDRNVLELARSLGFKDYEDAVQCTSDVAEGLDAIVTRNVKDFASSPLPVYSPAEFVALIQAEQASEEAD